ncbi:Short-chain dehydrogenase/reductase SDR [Carpediemonas membranifera]|uniref:Short-chain dehydrogenase/reductase SDR n=1 Tax=Carpediemonas membranifera TaxID=201153 RepID=A0A8J6E2X8_9EUKA|nr:Short-chain dehydrogenase/reductase SDR [Carpediemonas membranifera]|eukprot:KAG9395228.1 Short-chain dehydrogenase/reductase SDR [Carpediemonas membranifera]
MVKGFAKQGASRIVLLARRVEKLEELAKYLKEYGTETMCIKCDGTSSESVSAAAKAVEEKWTKVDVLVNNAGNAHNAGVLDMTDEQWDFM